MKDAYLDLFFTIMNVYQHVLKELLMLTEFASLVVYTIAECALQLILISVLIAFLDHSGLMNLNALIIVQLDFSLFLNLLEIGVIAALITVSNVIIHYLVTDVKQVGFFKTEFVELNASKVIVQLTEFAKTVL